MVELFSLGLGTWNRAALVLADPTDRVVSEQREFQACVVWLGTTNGTRNSGNARMNEAILTILSHGPGRKVMGKDSFGAGIVEEIQYSLVCDPHPRPRS